MAAKHRPRPVLSVAIAGVLLLAGLALAVFLLPGELQERDAYHAAPRCPTAEPAPGCRSQTPVTLIDKERRDSGKNRSRHMLFSRDGQPSQWVQMSGSAQVYDTVQPGDTLTATYWEWRIVEVVFRGQREISTYEPAYSVDGLVFLTSSLFVAGGFAGIVAFRHLRGRTLLKPDIRPLAAMGLGAGMLVGGLVVAAMVGGVVNAALTR